LALATVRSWGNFFTVLRQKRFGPLAVQFSDLVLDFVRHGLNFFVGEGLKGAFNDFPAKGFVEEDEVFQMECVRGLGGLLSRALVVGLCGCEFGLMFVAPLDESWFGDVEMVGDASEAPALGAEVEELIYGFGRVHSLYFLGASIERGVGQPLSYRKSTESLESLNDLND
jgi:hypothetical protein